MKTAGRSERTRKTVGTDISRYPVMRRRAGWERGASAGLLISLSVSAAEPSPQPHRRLSSKIEQIFLITGFPAFATLQTDVRDRRKNSRAVELLF